MNITFGNGGASLADIACAIDGKLLLKNSRNVFGVCTDSREVKRGDLFVAIRGERFDGHDFVGWAFEAGAVCAVVDHIPDSPDSRSSSLIIVDNTLDALAELARVYKSGLGCRTVAITGSVGKTTTKQFVYSVLSESFLTHKTEGNFNNEIGLPMSVLQTPASAEAAVFELGMSDFGQIRTLSKITAPDIAVITAIGSSHLATLGSREGIRDAKLEILEGMKPDGQIVLDGDEPLLSGIKNAVYVSLENEKADYYVHDIVEHDGCTVFSVTSYGHTVSDICVPTLGRHNVRDAVYALVVGRMFGMTDDRIIRGLGSFKNTGLRQQIRDVHGVTVIADCYNASPESMHCSLDVLMSAASSDGRTPVAVLGNMLDLGAASDELHRSVGRYAAMLGVASLYTFGESALKIAEGAADGGIPAECIKQFPNIDKPELLAACLRDSLSCNDTVLFKASRAVRLERVIELLEKG